MFRIHGVIIFIIVVCTRPSILRITLVPQFGKVYSTCPASVVHCVLKSTISLKKTIKFLPFVLTILNL